MLIALEQARSMAMFATMMAAEEDAGERRNALAAAKVQIGRSGKFIGQQAIQLHGGIGMTMEYKVGALFQAHDDDRIGVRRCRPPFASRRRRGRAHRA